MNGISEAQLTALRQEYDRLRRSTDLTSVTDAVWRLAQQVARFEERIDALRRDQYVFTASLTSSARELRDRWRSTEAEFDRAMRDVRYNVSRDVNRVEDAIRYAEEAPEAGRIGSAQNELQLALGRLQDAERRLRLIYERDERDISAQTGRLDALEWSLQQRNAATFNLDPGEALIIAAPAEWTEPAADDREIDGVLYLTDRRVLFEQKERTVAFLGIFGGRDQQALRWAELLDNIQDVRAEDRGMFGANDMLYLRLRPEAERGEIRIEIKRSADNQEWAAFIREAKRGGYESERR